MKRVVYACLLAILFAVCAQTVYAQLASSCWPKFHKDNLNTGQGLYGGTGSDLTWTFAAGSAIKSAPVVGVDGTVYFTCDDGRLYAVSGGGVKLWDYKCNCAGTSSPAIASDGTIYAGGTDNFLYAVKADGTLKWKRGVSSRLGSSISIGSDGTVYFGCTSGVFYAINASGGQKWSYTAGGAIYSSPAITSDGNTIYFGAQDGLYALNSTGTLKWKFAPTGSGAFNASPTIGSDGTIYIGSLGGFFYAVRNTGAQKWRANAGGGVASSAAIASNGNIYYGCRDNKIHSLSSNGTELWAYSSGHYVESSPALGTDGGVYVASLDGKLYALNQSGTSRWSYDTGGSVYSSPAIGPAGALFIGSDNGVLYCFAADATAPDAPVVTDAGGYTSILDRIQGSWVAIDAESGIFAYEYCIGTAPGTDNIAPWLNVGSAIQHTRTGHALVDKANYYITVRAVNGAGLKGPEASSDGIIADATSPSLPVVTDDGQYTSSAAVLHSSWSSADPESGIVSYQYSIGTAPGNTDTVGWTDVGVNTSVTRSGLTLANGVTYYFNIKSRSNGGAYSAVGSSDGITSDITPPSAPAVADAGLFISNAQSIFASWTSIDNESGISKYEYSIGTTAGGTQILSWTDAGISLQATIVGLSLTNGSTYYVNLRATNGSQIVGPVGSSDGVILDITSPDAPVVTDDGDYTASTTQLHAAWSASDAQSGIKSYKYSIGTSPGSTNIVPWTDNGTNTSVTRTGLMLTHNQKYYINVIAVNGASAESSVGSSNGIFVDATSPTLPVVTDDGLYTSDNSQLHATWSSGDPESQLARYEYSIGTSPGAIDTVDWTDVGLNTTVNKSGLSLADTKTYYINVRAYNKLGVLSAVGSSDGITVETVIPQPPVVADDGMYTLSSNTLHAAWSAVAPPSGIGSFDYSIGTTAGGTDVKDWTSLGVVYEVTVPNLSLVHGETYYMNLRARNSFGRIGHVGSSDGITVDLTVPTKPVVADSGVFTGVSNQLIASWTSGDPESGIAEYFYAIGRSAGAADVLNWTSAGTVQSVIIGSLSLIDGGTYYISVKAKNGAGGESQAGVSDGIIADLTAPTKPVVIDDGNYTTDSTNLHAEWSAVDAQSGVVKYEYSIGTSVGADDTLSWTNAGNSTEASITGLMLMSGMRYYINVRATNVANLVSEIGSSDGIFAETTPPTTPVVTDSGNYTQSTTTLTASWTSEDLETGVASYQYSIGTSAGLDDIIGWTNADLATSITRDDLSLQQGLTYYINVRATNTIGLVSEAGSSDGIMVDTTPSDIPIVTDDGAYTADNTKLHVALECNDAESGIASYEYALGTTSGGTEIISWTNGGPGPDITITDLTLQNGVTYYVSARAINGSGITGAVGTSDGIKLDMTPPVNLVVNDDGIYTGFDTSLHASWSATDPESGVAIYKYCVGTAPGQNDITGWIDVGNSTDTIVNGLSLVVGTTYYVSVIATNGAGGACSAVSSDGIRLDLTPPSKPVVTDNGIYWGYKTNLYGSWTAQDTESGIAEYQMSVGTSAGAVDVADWMSVGANASYTRTGLMLKDGITYFINIKAKNGAGGWGEVGSSDGILIDSTPPTTPVVIDDGDTTSILDMLHATWHSTDPEAGIAEYMYCIGTSPGATDLVAWTNAGLDEEITVTGLNMDPVLRYYISVKAKSKSGAWSAVSASDGIGYSSGAAIWWRFRNDSRNMGRGLFNATTVSDVAWIIPTEGYVESSPAISADGTSYVGSGDGKLYAVTQNGTLRWTYDAGWPIDSSPAIADNGNICFGCADGNVHCINQAGELVWAYNTGSAVESSPLIKDNMLYIGNNNGVLNAIKMDVGTKVWSIQTNNIITSAPAIDKDGIIYVTSEDSYLYALNPDGTLKWRFLTGSALIASPAIGSDGTIYIGSGDGYFYAVNSDGTQKWRYDAGLVVDSSAAIGPDGNIYFGAGYDGGNGRLFALQPDGTKIWQVDLPNGGIQSSPAIDPSGMIYVGSCNGKMYAFNPNGTVKWTFQTASSVMVSPALGADSSVVFGSYDGNIYCLRDITSKDLTPPTKPVVTVPGLMIPVGSPLVASWSSVDPESMVAEYTYAVGTEAGLSDVVGWTSAGIGTSISLDDLTLEFGKTYYVSVKARNPSQRWSEVGTSQGVTLANYELVETLGKAKLLDEGVQVALNGKVVTGVYDNCFFIEEPERFAGIRCMESGVDLRVGDRVNVVGTVGTVNDEKILRAVSHTFVASGEALKPVGLAGRTTSHTYPDLLGMCVRTWGTVAYVGDGFFVLSDGSNVQSAGGGMQIRGAGAAVAAGDLIGVSGILCREQVEDSPVTVLRATLEEGVTSID